MERILIVDDDPDIQRLVSYNLSQAGFETMTSGNGRKALDLAFKKPPDLIILDLMLPDVDGTEVCRTLRQNEATRRIPILMLSARSDEIDRVIGFEIGADDYVTKPFSPRELVLRVRSILRRKKDDRSGSIHLGRIHLHPSKRHCLLDDRQVFLTVKEFDLLHELLLASGNVLSREVLMDRVWGYHGEATSRTLDTHVRRLREKLGTAANDIETVRGIGYRIRTE